MEESVSKEVQEELSTEPINLHSPNVTQKQTYIHSRTKSKISNIKKYRSAYIIFCSEIRAILKNKKNNNNNNNNISKNKTLNSETNEGPKPENTSHNCKLNPFGNKNSINSDEVKNQNIQVLDEKLTLLHKELISNHIPNSDLTKKIAVLWRHCTEQERAVYREREKAEKKRFESKKQKSGLKYKYKKCERFRKPVRFRTPFMFFIREHKHNMQNKDKFQNIEYIRAISEQWVKISREEKQKYINLANEDKTRYDCEYDNYMKQIFSINAKNRKTGNKRSEKIKKILSKIHKNKLKVKKSKLGSSFSLSDNWKNLGLEELYKIKTENSFNYFSEIEDNNNFSLLNKLNEEEEEDKEVIKNPNNIETKKQFLKKKRRRKNKNKDNNGNNDNKIFLIDKVPKKKNTPNKNNVIRSSPLASELRLNKSNEDNQTGFNTNSSRKSLNLRHDKDSCSNLNQNCTKNFGKLKLKDNISDLVKYEFDRDFNQAKSKTKYQPDAQLKTHEDIIKEKLLMLKSSINNFVNDNNSFINGINNSNIKSNFNCIINNLNNSNALFSSLENKNFNKEINKNLKFEDVLSYEKSPEKLKSNSKPINNYFNRNKSLLFDNERDRNSNLSSLGSNLININSGIVNYEKSKNNYGNLKSRKSTYRKSVDNLDIILANYEMSNSNIKSECLEVNGDSLDLNMSIDMEGIENEEKSYP